LGEIPGTSEHDPPKVLWHEFYSPVPSKYF